MPSTTTTAALLILPLPLSTLIFANNVRVMLFATPLSLLLNRTLHLTPAAVNAFYATMFVPSAFEAVYALLSDRLPWRGERRRPYFVALVQALSTLFLARGQDAAHCARQRGRPQRGGCEWLRGGRRSGHAERRVGRRGERVGLRWGGNLVATLLGVLDDPRAVLTASCACPLAAVAEGA